MVACSASERLLRRRSPDDNSQPPTSQLPTLGIGDWKLGVDSQSPQKRVIRRGTAAPRARRAAPTRCFERLRTCASLRTRSRRHAGSARGYRLPRSHTCHREPASRFPRRSRKVCSAGAGVRRSTAGRPGARSSPIGKTASLPRTADGRRRTLPGSSRKRENGRRSRCRSASTSRAHAGPWFPCHSPRPRAAPNPGTRSAPRSTWAAWRWRESSCAQTAIRRALAR